MQKLGQHFLKDASVAEKIVRALALAEGDRVIEVGPGHGELTIPLLRAAATCSCVVTSIERDRALIPPLAALQEKYPPGMFTLAEGDALALIPEIVAALPHSEPRTEARSSAAVHPTRYKIAGNIPYYITGHLLRIMSELPVQPERAVLMVQKEVADRICASPPRMNRLAASVQFWADAEIVALVPRGAFSPPPDVDSAVIALRSDRSVKKAARRGTDPAQYYKTVRTLFSQPRKTILNNLSAVFAVNHAADKAAIVALLAEISIDHDARAQNLSIAQIAAIANAIKWG